MAPVEERKGGSGQRRKGKQVLWNFRCSRWLSIPGIPASSILQSEDGLRRACAGRPSQGSIRKLQPIDPLGPLRALEQNGQVADGSVQTWQRLAE